MKPKSQKGFKYKNKRKNNEFEGIDVPIKKRKFETAFDAPTTSNDYLNEKTKKEEEEIEADFQRLYNKKAYEKKKLHLGIQLHTFADLLKKNKGLEKNQNETVNDKKKSKKTKKSNDILNENSNNLTKKKKKRSDKNDEIKSCDKEDETKNIDNNDKNPQKDDNTIENKEIDKKNDEKTEYTDKEILLFKLQSHLKSASFRLINEKLYTTSSDEAKDMFSKESKSFSLYHEGFKQQQTTWPINPVNEIANWLKHKDDHLRVVDMGAGDGPLARIVPQRVLSFDLVAPEGSGVIECDMARTPLRDGSCDVVVFCLSLMGTNLADYIIEASRILVNKGLLKIAEVETRFGPPDTRKKNKKLFENQMRNFGFSVTSKSTKNPYFWLFQFYKQSEIDHKGRPPTLKLHPCLYKKR